MSNACNLHCSEECVLHTKQGAISQESDSALKKLHKVPLWIPQKHVLLTSCQNGCDNEFMLAAGNVSSPVVCIVCVESLHAMLEGWLDFPEHRPLRELVNTLWKDMQRVEGN